MNIPVFFVFFSIFNCFVSQCSVKRALDYDILCQFVLLQSFYPCVNCDVEVMHIDFPDN